MENIKTTTNSQNLNLSEQFKDDVWYFLALKKMKINYS